MNQVVGLLLKSHVDDIVHMLDKYITPNDVGLILDICYKLLLYNYYGTIIHILEYLYSVFYIYICASP